MYLDVIMVDMPRGRVLYKYLKKNHANLLLKKGSFRLGTLYEYRDEESYGQVIGDASEGTRLAYEEIDHVTRENQSKFSKQFVNLEAEGSGMSNLTLQVEQHSPDCYIYCTAEEFDKNALSDFGYDTCVVIEDPNRFFAALSHTIRHKAKFEGIFHCQYMLREVHYTSDIPPAIIKDPKYQNQKEVRGVWSPTKQQVVEPIYLTSKKAARYCKLFTSRAFGGVTS